MCGIMESEDETHTAKLLPESGGEEIGGSFTSGVFNLATTIIGAGIMALPATMKILGLVPGVLMILLMAVLTNATIEFLVRFSSFGQQRSYGALVEESCGRIGRILLQVSVIVSNIGVLIVYMIIIGDVSAGLLEPSFGETWWTTRLFLLLITTLSVFPWTWFKRIDDLRISSCISSVLALVFLITIAIITIKKVCSGDYMKPRFIPNVTDLSSFTKLFTVVPVLVSAYVCHYNVHSIQVELKDEAQITPVVGSALGICACVYSMISISGYLLFGDATLDDVLANFDTNLGISFGFIVVIRSSYVAHLIFVFPIVFHPLRVNVDGLFFPAHPPLASSQSTWRFHSITALLILLIFIGANFIPNIWDVFQITGATVSVSLGFIFPAAVILKNHHNQATNRDKTIAIFMIVLAVFSSGISIFSFFTAKTNTTFFTSPT